MSTLDTKTKINLCVACTLAPSMMDCSKCPFNVGIVIRNIHLRILDMEPSEREKVWASMPQALWDVYFDYISTIAWTYPPGYNPYKELGDIAITCNEAHTTIIT